jgi:hypothetical protein
MFFVKQCLQAIPVALASWDYFPAGSLEVCLKVRRRVQEWGIRLRGDFLADELAWEPSVAACFSLASPFGKPLIGQAEVPTDVRVIPSTLCCVFAGSNTQFR